MADQDALKRLENVLAECCLAVAEMTAEAEESRARQIERALELRARLGTVSRMAGLGPLPEFAVERRVRAVAS